MLIIDIKGTEISQQEIEILSHPLVAGLILFSRNFVDKAQLTALIKEIRQKVTKPLLITIDQEGGRVQRFREGFTRLPAMQAFGQLAKHPQEAIIWAKQAGWLMAAEMFALDIDLSFAPVLDLGHKCKAIGDRSFGEKVTQILPIAEGFIDGMREIGMATTGKHFPGHGQVIADSHLETPFDERAKANIFNYDIQPFEYFIAKNKLSAIMPAHVVYTQCDPHPASGSTYWLQQVLRQQLQFKGIIFSDDLGMQGANLMGNFLQRSEQAINAGCDLLLLCDQPEGVIEVLNGLTYQPNKLEQQKYLTLKKRRTIDFQQLASSPRYQQTKQHLEQLHECWLEWQTTH
ncbi:beta-N-acetylhexosaminidase [[Haemophilus] ducreyi]|uniref:beta-N-acetylhexosaminidase n=1 Tax=Haemophilus ducreyi TaxID=730 RepID=UPI0007CDDAD4|nr:beta-N-acetylhexosaminidase [[Haemophilus] ducreyi]ANF70233.1 beta-N-acetylhexosaminidase [[Haemophilus] ducreyi]ANF72583.1 beta-N-acetylhexosaminidase [[Haemophilus] ducreyi]